MKKQLLIAAVAATMTSAAMADISITGDLSLNTITLISLQQQHTVRLLQLLQIHPGPISELYTMKKLLQKERHGRRFCERRKYQHF
jgi:hypothetical protein